MTLADLVNQYEDWSDRRADQSLLEADGKARPDDWYALDDEGCELAESFAVVAEKIAEAVSEVFDVYSNGIEEDGRNMYTALNDLHGIVELDTMSSASRQHRIDTGRYLFEGQALTNGRDERFSDDSQITAHDA